ncbi:DcuS/MalK family sensor histidine kinase [Halobacillus mangrovi]|uniref:histidine kinase n=1 Tax=Halobacillus mangrovi TaxID=402384 RepID=A0A1W5ZTZ9_9BACI|nr:DcuS/MalK family sensor histidine kinase [Halobacillus mangrovi]ARI76786.1 two-component system sensor histidine kinase DcuS [Halobacillus mangrovi]
MYKSRLKLRTIIILFVCLVVSVSLLITGLLIRNTTTENIETQLQEKAMTVARTVAESTVVENRLQGAQTEESIQSYAMTIQKASDVMFVVVMDMKGIRYSHPDPKRIGNHFVGGDEKRVLQGQEYTSRSTGTLGKSLRAFTPVYNDKGNQLGAVSVGISLEAVESSIHQSQKQILIGSIIGAFVGIIGAFLLANYIKQSLFGLEPHAIARIHEERNQMLHSVHEGIIAIDNEAKILLVNNSARQIFEKAGLGRTDPIGMKIQDFLPGTKLDQLLTHKESDIDKEQWINGVSVITNRVPLVINNHTIGAIATFRDKTEVNQLAEQLTGVQMYADTLRAQSHEFMNKLHVLLGMIKMENYEQVKHYINQLVEHSAHEVGNVTRYVKDPVIAGFLIGKMSYSREAQVHLKINCETEIPVPHDNNISHELITILGNLINNAVESVRMQDRKKVSVNLSVIDELLTIVVEDNGPGIPEEKHQVIFEKGISTKDGKDRGFGLHITKLSVEKLEGSIEVESSPVTGTVFTIIIPYEEEVTEND